VAFLMTFGLFEDEATAVIEKFGAEAAGAPKLDVDASSRYAALYAVCSSCVRRAEGNLPKPVLNLPGAEVPVVGQP